MQIIFTPFTCNIPGKKLVTVSLKVVSCRPKCPRKIVLSITSTFKMCKQTWYTMCTFDKCWIPRRKIGKRTISDI